MVERLGAAVLELRTDDARFTKGVARAEVGARKLDRGLKKTGRSARTLGARLSALGARVGALGRSMFSLRNAAVLAAGVVGLGLLTKKALDLADAIAKSADVIGISTDTLQKYRFAAGQAGVDQGKFTQALKTFGKQLGELRTTGLGTLSELLKKMNPALLQSLAAANTVEEGFLLLLDALGNTTNQMERLAVSSAAFGRGAGAAIVNIAKDGGEAFREWARRLEEAGGIIPEKLLRQAEAAKDELAFLAEVIKVQLTIALLQAAPEITRLAKAFSDAIPGIVEFLLTIFTGFRDNVLPPIKVAIEVVGLFVDALGFLFASAAEGIRVLGELFGLLDKPVGFAGGGSFVVPEQGLARFQRGGSFSVGGGGGVDSQLVQFMATPGERVTVTPEGGARDGTRFNIDARGADLGIERRIERAMQRAVRLASAQAGNNLASALRASGV